MEAKKNSSNKISFNVKKETQNSIQSRPFHHPHLPHHPSHHHEYGFGASLIGMPTPESPISGLFEHREDFESTMEVITCEGPSADQVRSAIIIRLLELLYSKTPNISSLINKGVDVTSTNHMGFHYLYPIDFPNDLFESLGNDADNVFALISEGPRHRVEFDLLLIKGLYHLYVINTKNV